MESLIKLAGLSYSYILKNFYNKKTLYSVFIAYGVFKTIYLVFIDPLRKIPGPWYARFSANPANRASLKGEITRYLQSLHDKYGPIVRVTPDKVSVSNTKEFKKILASYKYRKTEGVEGFANVHESILSTRDEDFNRMRRRQVGPAFSTTGLNSVDSIVFELCVTNVEKKFIRDIELGGGAAEFNYFKHYQNIAADVIGELAFGKSFDAVKNDGHDVTNWVNSAMRNFVIFKSFPLLKLIQRMIPALTRDETRLKNYCLQAIKQRKDLIKNNNYNGKRVDILQMYLAAINTSNNKPLSEDELISEMVTMVAAGVDTTSITMTWLTVYYMLYPHVYKRVLDEIRTNFPDKDRKITQNDAKEKLPYFIATVYETLRVVGPAGGILFREAPNDGVEILGYNIPQGNEVGMFIPGTHNDTEVWNDPRTFNPDRFLGPEGEKFKREIVAFSTGVRICPGRNLAWMEILQIIPNMLKDFDLELPADSKFGPNILDPKRNNQPLLPKDITFSTRPPANPDADCNIVIKKRVY
ncbi:Versicolorin B desaturase [Smittium culicis]|uniref:Versicolorin B desaturase n=1 Tax=Smittium culicis TaxID=133412 RepID=A0A1R1XLE3_9FUNG|nr:Versicolorin B desaturase [Smittium culicis]OMJ15454.1 Versicolorin B desaturase [Smittium culicis]